MIRDVQLEKRLARYDAWMNEGKIPYSSKVIPVDKSISTLQWVLPTQQVMAILRNARTFALTNCECRERYGRCDHPLEVCFLINDMAERYTKLGKGRRISLGEAAGILKLADERGLIHLTIYNPEQHVYALCSCCSCCCHDLQFLQRYGRSDLIARSDYIVKTNMEECVHCGRCVERCVFSARRMIDGRMTYTEEACYGCGLCVSVCPSNANTMRLRSIPGHEKR